MASFDGIANKFDKNIYGTTKGQLRHKLLCHYLSDLLDGEPIETVDIGGGTGVMANEFAKRGHSVLNLDVSLDTLDIARQRLEPYKNARVLQGSLFDWKGTADLIICHAVLEWLPNPEAAIEYLWEQLPDKGYFSISFFNHHAALFNNAIYGNFDYIKKGMNVRNQVRLNPKYPLKPEPVIEFIQSLKHSNILHSAGIRCFHDYMRDKELQSASFDDIFELELIYGNKAPYKYLGKYFHILCQKSDLAACPKT